MNLMNLRKAVLKLFSGGLVLSVLEFAAISLFTQISGAAAIGSFFVFQALVGIIGVPGDLGVSRAAEKQLAGEDPQGEVMATAVILKGLLISPWVLILFLAAQYVESYVGVVGITPFVALGLITSQGRRLSIRFLAGQLRVGQTALLRLIGKVAWIFTGLILVEVNWGATGIIAAFILGDIMTILGALARMNITVSWPTAARARQMLNFGRYVFIGSVSGYVYSWMDVAILRLFVPVSLVGAYEVAWRVASLSMMLSKAIKDTLFPQISRWHTEERYDEIENAFKKWMQPPLYLTIPAFMGAIVLGRDILRILFDADIVVAYPVLLIFMLERTLRTISMLLGPSLFAMDKPKWGYRGNVASILVNLVLNVSLIPFFGIMGAAVATTLGSAVSVAMNINYVSRIVPIHFPWSRVAWSTGSAVLMASTVYLLYPFLLPGLRGLILGIGCGICIYMLLLFSNTTILEETMEMISSLHQ